MTNLKQTVTHLTLGLLLALLLTGLGGSLVGAGPAPTTPPELLQFQSGGHVLGFTPAGMYLSNGTYALRVEFVEANPVVPQAANSAPATDGAAPPLTQVTYPNLWPGISLTYDAGGGLARSTYSLAPGADPAAIRLRYNAPVTVEADGSLRISYDTGALHESTPLAWQEIDGRRVAVEVAFQTWAGSETDKVSTVGFRLGRYDPRYPLTIDPTLTWNTFLGGSGVDWGYAIAIDGSGNLYVAGESSNTWGSPVRPYSGGFSDAFVAKLSGDGSLIWNTFLGSDYSDSGYGLAVDGSGNVYVVGKSNAAWSCSPIPCTVRPYTPPGVFPSNPGLDDAFVAKLGSDGSLTWNTFVGSFNFDTGYNNTSDSFQLT